MRARFDPAHRWGPAPKDRCRLRARSRSKACGAGELGVVAVGRRPVEEHPLAGLDPLPADLGVAGGGAGDGDERRVEAQQLLDRGRQQRRAAPAGGRRGPGPGRTGSRTGRAPLRSSPARRGSSSWMTPRISWSVIGRPSISAAEHGVDHVADRRARPGAGRTNSEIQAAMPCQRLGPAGVVRRRGRVGHLVTARRTSSGGACSTCSKKARPGSGRANASMNSQRPSSTKPSISRVTSARVASS